MLYVAWLLVKLVMLPLQHFLGEFNIHLGVFHLKLWWILVFEKP